MGQPEPVPVPTTYTLGLDSPVAMAAAAKVAGAAHGHLKIKLGAGGDDLARLRAIRDAVPDARLIADVNEAWTLDMLVASLPELAALGIEMLEQIGRASGRERVCQYGSDPVVDRTLKKK